MSEAQLYAPDYLRAQKDKQLHLIADMIEAQVESITKLRAENVTLREHREELVQAVKFYADYYNYDDQGVPGKGVKTSIPGEPDEYDFEPDVGAVAQAVLKEVGE